MCGETRASVQVFAGLIERRAVDSQNWMPEVKNLHRNHSSPESTNRAHRPHGSDQSLTRLKLRYVFAESEIPGPFLLLQLSHAHVNSLIALEVQRPQLER